MGEGYLGNRESAEERAGRREIDDVVKAHSDRERQRGSGEPFLRSDDLDEFGESALPELRSFERLFRSLEGATRVPEQQLIERYRDAADSIDRLKLLVMMQPSDAAECIRLYSPTEGSYRYLVRRLDFYQRALEGKATKRYEVEKWQNGEYIKFMREEPITTEPEHVQRGLLRDTLYAAMIGTPELAAYKIANRQREAALNANSRSSGTRVGCIELRGYHSLIRPGNVGYGYPLLHRLIEQATRQIERYGVDPEQVEHRAVRLAAKWLARSTEYNPGRGPGSPYVGSPSEAVAWAQLGLGVQRQFRGMRHKLQGIDLHNIGRFVGVSGDNPKYRGEKRWLEREIESLELLTANPHAIDESEDRYRHHERLKAIAGIRYGDPDHYSYDAVTILARANEQFTAEYRDKALQRLESWHGRELALAADAFTTAMDELEQTDLPEKERFGRQLATSDELHDRRMQLAKAYEQRKDVIEAMSPEELLKTMEERHRVVTERYEKRKSLAQKALDLHFRLNHPQPTGETYRTHRGSTRPVRERGPYADIIDWINYAPFGTIKRSHRLLQRGVSEETVMQLAVADIWAGRRGIERSDLNEASRLLTLTTGGDYAAGQKLKSMLMVGNILSRYKYELALSELSALSSQNFYGLHEVLKYYDLEETRNFLAHGCDLSLVATVRCITQQFGHDLDPATVAEMAKGSIHGLESALTTFSLPDVQRLLREGVSLEHAQNIQRATLQRGQTLSLDEIATIVKDLLAHGMYDTDNFTESLKVCSLTQARQLTAEGIRYLDQYEPIRAALASASFDASFKSIQEWARKLGEESGYSAFATALVRYAPDGVEQILRERVPLGAFIQIDDVLDKLKAKLSFSEIIQVARFTNPGDWVQSYHLEQAVTQFGLDETRELVRRRLYLSHAVGVRDALVRAKKRETADNLPFHPERFTNFETIARLAQFGDNLDTLVTTLRAGFTVDEVEKLPFLISPLLAKRLPAEEV